MMSPLTNIVHSINLLIDYEDWEIKLNWLNLFSDDG